ncbi:ovochymase-2-like [Salvelinus namaycush]|uniref:Ovochymase-2-like n=1 Tax=Salvelinus namaycush TaxID=8040 RepID=A0A8U0Q733_SALNM|nr:ovochymase-2-like [Salvelinus namaycush]
MEEDLKQRPKSRGLSTLEKSLILLFVALTGACVGLVVIYFTDKNSVSTDEEVNSGCGGPQALKGPSGEFTSMNHPSSYDNGMSCSWRITVDPGMVIHLWFEDFSLEATDLCTADYFTIQDNLGVIGRLCGRSKPGPIVSLGNAMLLFFDTNDRNTDTGFKAKYQAVTPESTLEIAGAGGALQGDRGDLLTPGFPAQNYENGALYQWRISVPEGEKIRLTFSSFDLVPEACRDYVDVYDGHKTGSAMLGRFCGSKNPGRVDSSGNTMVVRFKTDATLTSKGFSATFTKTGLIPTTVKPTTMMPTTPAITDSGCGGVGTLLGRKGEIHSMGFPDAYPGNLHCSWNITAPEGFLVKLHVTDMSVTGEAGQCGEDKLVVSDSLQALGTHCGYVLPPVVVSANNKMSLSFLSDSRLSDRGFSAKWEAVYPEDIAAIQGCGGASHEIKGVIKSQNWPMNYKAASECMWSVEVPKGKTITLTFTHFDVEAKDIFTSKCLDNMVAYDLDNDGAESTKHGPWCGDRLPATITTKGNKLVMRFHTDFFVEAKGFRAYWTTDTTQPVPTEPPVQPNPWDNITVEWPTTCGKPAIPPTIHTRIVNGEPANPHSWPWQVSMQVWPSSQETPKFFHTCGGTLIHKNWVMTAAHCFIRYADELQRWKMCLGKHNLTFTEDMECCFSVTGIYRHEGFKYPTLPTVEFDIALVRLGGEVTPSDQISYSCLPSLEEVLEGGKKCYATGWGDETGDSMNAKVAETLNQVALPVVPFNTCKKMDYWWFQVKTSMICMGYTLPDELKSVCQGDSGGPLVCQDSPNAPWEVHGITSFGPNGCIMDKKPSVFTRASAYIPWMENVIRRDMYNQHTSGCGGPKDLTGESGMLSSMGHPGSYSNGAHCQWHIKVPDGKLVHLHFHNFSLEDTQLCLNDKVTINDSLASLGTYCSHIPPQDLVSIGDRLSLYFTSNNKVVDTGFRASWKAVDPSQASCGGVFSSEQGELTSPNWPNNYLDQAVCTWHISIPSAKNIHIVFTHFEVQAVNQLGQCVDYVEIYGGAGLTSQGRFCGFAPPPEVTVVGNTAVVRFLSNKANVEKGFRGYWTTDPNMFPTLPPPPANPWDNITISWPETCGSPAVPPSSATLRVVNGVEAVPHSWPWQVSMQASPFNPIPYMHGCGGSLIHKEWVLTAAHCFMAPLGNPTYWRMCLGKHHMNSSRDLPSHEACYKVDGIIRHKGFVYEQDKTDITNDIALVHLSSAVNMTREISPVCLPALGALMPAGKPCYVTGWGDEKGSLFPVVSEKLNQAALPIVPFATCSKPAYWWDTLRPSMICAGYESPDELKSACQGDSGGPFACQPSASDPWEVHGIVSFGAFGCVKDKKPSVFTRVSSFNDWIDDNMKRFIYEKSLD